MVLPIPRTVHVLNLDLLLSPSNFNQNPFISFYLTFFYKNEIFLWTFRIEIRDFDQKTLFPGKGRFWPVFNPKMTNILANNGLNNLTPSDRAKLAENRQVMKAYLISKLVAPRYEVDESGRINPEHFKKGHLGSTEYHQRQRTVQ